MENIVKTLVNAVKEFIEPSPKPSAISLHQNKLAQTIRKAQESQQDLHAIYGDKSFTGHLVKYDAAAGKIILKNFPKNISVIISTKDIQKLSLVPPTISKAQQIKN